MKVHLYERLWIILGIVMLALFLGVVTVTAFVAGRQPPGHAEMIAPEAVMTDPRVSPQGVREVGPGKYEVRMVAQMFSLAPNQVRVPRGAEVTFLVASPDVIHGFEVVGTNANAMVIPGRLTTVTTKFDKPGQYLVICNEYCGAAHQIMAGTLIVE